jgi:hypothetical protein
VKKSVPTVKAASYIGFFAMIGLGIGAFVWGDQWWAMGLLLAAALSVGWYSLGLFARASTVAARRAMLGMASPDDLELLGELGGRARGEAFRAASYDPQRDRIFDEMVGMFGSEEGAVEMILEHAQAKGCEVDDDEARGLLEDWRLRGIVNDISLGAFLDVVWAELANESAGHPPTGGEFGRESGQTPQAPRA